MNKDERFTLIKNTGTDECYSDNLYDNGTYIGAICGGSEMICYLLNNLHEENQDLKSFNEDLAENLSACANARISKDNWIEKLTEENEQLKKQREELFIRERDTKNDWRELKQENELLKSFIDDLTTKGIGRIDLANGYSYRVSAVLTNWKGDVE